MHCRARTLTGLVAILALFLSFSTASASQTELENIQNAIQQKGARWTAGETSVSKLPEMQRLTRVGLAMPPANFSSRRVAAVPTPVGVTLPASLDYRNFNGVNFVTSVKDQGSCGDCWAFGSTAATESYVLLHNPQLQAANLNLSEQILLSCSGAGNCEQGGSDEEAAQYIENVGLPPESYFPYTATDNSCSNAAQNWESQTYKIPSWQDVTGQSCTVQDLKNALYTYGPLVTTMEVYSDFMYYTGGVYSYTSGTDEGGHAIELIGYDDSQQAFICKNSWGTDWGQNGYFEIAYSQVSTPTVGFGEYSVAYGSGLSTGTLTVSLNTSPSGLSLSGAEWSTDGGATWHNSGQTVSLIPGSYTVSFSAVSGFTAPSSQTVTVSQGANASVTATYVQQASSQGNLTVTLQTSPSGLSLSGAQWSVDGTNWHNSGQAVSLAAGNYTVSFSTVSGFTAPASQTATVSAGSNTSIAATYVQQTPAGGLWQNATVINGWDYLSWFGTFSTVCSPWIYHTTLGWLYPFGTSTSSIWFWDPVMNTFWWTSDSTFPYLYRASDGTWLYYKKGTSNPRLFFNFNTGAWEAH